MNDVALLSSAQAYQPLTSEGDTKPGFRTILVTEQRSNLASFVTLSTKFNDQFKVNRRHGIKVAAVVGFKRTGRTDTDVDIHLTLKQWYDSKWNSVQSVNARLPANVTRYVIAFPPIYKLKTDLWAALFVTTEHTYSEECVEIIPADTIVEVSGSAQ